MTRRHSDALSIHLGAYVQTADPGAVGAKKLWVDTTGGEPYTLKVRNTGNTAWEEVGSAGGSGDIAQGGNAFAAPLVIGTTDTQAVSIITDGVERLGIADDGVATFPANVVAMDDMHVEHDLNMFGNLHVEQDAEVIGNITADGNINTSDFYRVNGVQVVGLQQTAVANAVSPDAPTQTAGYVQADVQDIADLANELKAQVNDLLAKMRTHGLIGI